MPHRADFIAILCEHATVHRGDVAAGRQPQQRTRLGTSGAVQMSTAAAAAAKDNANAAAMAAAAAAVATEVKGKGAA